MKYFRIGTKGGDNALAYYVYAPTVAAALKELDPMIGGINQNALDIRELPKKPAGLAPPAGDAVQILDPADEDEE